MSEYHATIDWQRTSSNFDYASYNRSHQWHLKDGVTVDASAAPVFLGTPDRVDPEEAFVAVISSCHMLTFLAICARKRITVNAYLDKAVGYMTKNLHGRLAITRVELFPVIDFEDGPPGEKTIREIHKLSHRDCFIANSVKTDIQVRQLYKPESPWL